MGKTFGFFFHHLTADTDTTTDTVDDLLVCVYLVCIFPLVGLKPVCVSMLLFSLFHSDVLEIFDCLGLIHSFIGFTSVFLHLKEASICSP